MSMPSREDGQTDAEAQDVVGVYFAKYKLSAELKKEVARMEDKMI